MSYFIGQAVFVHGGGWMIELSIYDKIIKNA